MRAEILKIPAVVENYETALVRIFSVDFIDAAQPRAKPRAAADHLPEFRLRAHLLEKYQIHRLRHVYARVHHVHGYGYVRLLVGNFKILQQSLRVGVVADDAPREPAAVLRIEFVEPLHDKLRVILVLRENNALAEAVSALYADAVLHQILQNRVNSSLVENKFIELRRWDELRHLAIFRKIVLVALFILVRQIVVCYPLFEEFRPHLAVVVRDEHLVRFHSRVVVVRVGRHARLHIEKIIGVAVHVGLRRRRQADEHGVEIVENRAVLFENAPVALVYDN